MLMEFYVQSTTVSMKQDQQNKKERHKMNANELADAMEIRASIRRKATSRKSVTEGANDRLADQLDQAATMLRQQQAEIESLKKELETLQKNNIREP